MKKTRLKGPLYRHLGHFRQPKFLDAGHNTGVHPEKKSDRYGRTDEGFKIKVPDIEEARERRKELQNFEPEWLAADIENRREADKMLDSEMRYRNILKNKGLTGAALEDAMEEYRAGYDD